MSSLNFCLTLQIKEFYTKPFKMNQSFASSVKCKTFFRRSINPCCFRTFSSRDNNEASLLKLKL